MKKLLLPFLAMLFLISCGKEDSTDLVSEVDIYENSSATNRNPNKRNVCHNGNIINININAIAAHQAHGDAVDMDGDGFFDIENPCSATDCDDNDANINPDVEEIPYNGTDDDCNYATPDDDIDGDGFLNENDCDDNNPAVNPDAPEICDNGIDDDCDGDVDETDNDCSTSCMEGEVEIDFNGPLFVAPTDEPGYYTWQQAINRCNSKNTGGCDWYLPSKDELNAMHLAKNEIGGFDQSGTFPGGYYWSSTEYPGFNGIYAWDQRFSDGYQGAGFKEYGLSCRCVRR